MFDDIRYVVRFENGNYYQGGFSSNNQTSELKFANQYLFDWQIIKDHLLQYYVNEYGLSYNVIKVKTIYEIIE